MSRPIEYGLQYIEQMGLGDPKQIQEIAAAWQVEFDPNHPLPLQLGLLSYAVPRPITEDNSQRYRAVVGLMERMAMVRFVDERLLQRPDIDQIEVLGVGIALRGGVAEVNQVNIAFLEAALAKRGLGRIKVAPFAVGIKRDPFGEAQRYFAYYPDSLQRTRPEHILVNIPDSGGASGQTFVTAGEMVSRDLGIPVRNLDFDCMFLAPEAERLIAEMLPEATTTSFLRGALNEIKYLNKIGLPGWQEIDVDPLDWGEASVLMESPGYGRSEVVRQVERHVTEVDGLLGSPSEMATLDEYLRRKYPVLPGDKVDLSLPVFSRSDAKDPTINRLFMADVEAMSGEAVTVGKLNASQGALHLRGVGGQSVIVDASQLVYANGWSLVQK